jgi:DNA polymerase III subunit delta'
MAFADILGQEAAVGTLKRALESGRVHHAYRFEGPDGVGKELAAFALAQALVCEKGPAACGACSACRRAVTLAEDDPRVPLHPDVVLVERGLYKTLIAAGEATGISIEQVRRIVLGRAGYTPHEGRALVFIVRAAEELTPQAANALLKTLEEPPPRTHFVLLTSRPSRLLDTIRSRTLPVRFAPLPDQVVAQILEARGLDSAVAPLAQGSAGQALLLADPERQADRESFVAGVLEALEASDLSAALKLGESRRADRQELGELLGHLGQALAARSRALAESEPARAEHLAQQYDVVLSTLGELEKNVQPALAFEAMMVRLRQAQPSAR